MTAFIDQFQVFVLLLARMLAMLSISPFYAGQALAYLYRMGLAFFVALLVTPVVEMPPEFEKLMADRYVLLILEQVFMGLIIGFSLQFLFAAFQMAGEFFSVQMGFGISEVFDPMSQISLPLLGIVKNMIALFVFFVSGAHLFLIKAIVFSFEKVPYMSINYPVGTTLIGGLTKYIIMLSSAMFVIALKIALPVIGVLILTSMTLGLLYKAAPQMNILMIGFPLKILIAFFVLVWISPTIVEIMFSQFDNVFNQVEGLIKNWY